MYGNHNSYNLYIKSVFLILSVYSKFYLEDPLQKSPTKIPEKFFICDEGKPNLHILFLSFKKPSKIKFCSSSNNL